jgi:hypothetical protein
VSNNRTLALTLFQRENVCLAFFVVIPSEVEESLDLFAPEFSISLDMTEVLYGAVSRGRNVPVMLTTERKKEWLSRALEDFI